MHIEKIKLKNYRNYNDFEMEFQDGLNVIIGPNNSGKTGLLYAIQLLNKPNEISVNDFNKNNLMNYNQLYTNEAPSICIEYDIKHQIKESDTSDESIIKLLPFLGMDKIMSSKTESKDDIEYNIYATIKAVFSIDAKYLEEYKTEVQQVKNYQEYLVLLTRYVTNHYCWEYTDGHSPERIEYKLIKSVFDIRFIDAERTSEGVRKETKKEIEKFINESATLKKLDDFRNDATGELTAILQPALDKMDSLFGNEKNEIGLKKGNVSISGAIQPNISITDAYITEVLDTKGFYNLPLEYNGLGYNNLINIYMLIKLSDIKKGIDFRILCLEEPEAHLHPAMQYKLFKYLSTLDKNNELNQQVFVTTHSSNISAVAGLDNMYMIQYNRNQKSGGDCCQQSLKKQFTDKKGETDKSQAKKHLRKFLDVTRSDMLFADKVILVEGIAEKLLLSMFMEKCGVPYEDEHISIVEIGGKHFEYFIELFNNNAVKKKVLCITDNDFKWIEENRLQSKQNYKGHIPDHIEKINKRFNFQEFKYVTQSKGGRTFEDELFFENFDNKELANKLFKMVFTTPKNQQVLDSYGFNIAQWDAYITDFHHNSQPCIQKYIEAYNERVDKSESEYYEKIIFSEIFLHYAKNNKGDLALQILVEDDFFGEDGITKLKVPTYIEEGIEWLMK